MNSQIGCLRDSTPLPLQPDRPPAKGPLHLVIPFFNPSLAAYALGKAVELARGFESVVTLVAVYVLPYPSPLEPQEGIRQRLEAQLTAVARTSPVSTAVNVVFARDRDQAYDALLRRPSLVVVGTRNRWWKTGEERFAAKLAARGHSIAVVKVK